ncbi:UbiA prenyltransferase family protein [Sinomicrobium sp.]
MERLIRLLNFYIEASIHVALSACALTVITVFNFDLPFDWYVCLSVFFGTIVGYNFIKYGSEARRFYVVRTRYVKSIQYFSFVCFAICAYCLIHIRLPGLIVLFGLILLSFFYAVPLNASVRNIRNFPGIKIFIVALVWSGATVWLPLANNLDASGSVGLLGEDMIIEGIQRFLFVIVLTIPFEIRDMAVDDLSLGTIPQKVGVKNTRYIGALILLLVLFMELLKQKSGWSDFFGLLITSELLGLALWYSRVDQKKYYCSFWVEGIPIVWMVLLLLLN